MIAFRFYVIMEPQKPYTRTHTPHAPTTYFWKRHILHTHLIPSPLTLFFHAMRFYCALILGRESRRSPQVAMQGPIATWHARKVLLAPSSKPDSQKNRFHYNLNLWATKIKHVNISKTDELLVSLYFKCQNYMIVSE